MYSAISSSRGGGATRAAETVREGGHCYNSATISKFHIRHERVNRALANTGVKCWVESLMQSSLQTTHKA